MGKSAVLSGLLHLAVILLTVIGLPWLYSTDEVLQATPVAVITEQQFAELKNQKPPAQKKPTQPTEQQIPDAPKAPDVPEPVVEPEPPPEPEPAPEPEPQPAPEPEPAPPPEPEQTVQPEPPPEPEPQAVVPPEPEPPTPPEPEKQPVIPQQQVAEAQPKPVPPKKPDPPKKKEKPKEEAKKKEKPKEKQVAEEDSSWLKDIIKDTKKKQKSSKKSQPTQQAALPPADYDGPPLSEGEKDLIRQQVQGNWIIDIGMQGLEDMTVEVKVRMNPDGSVQSAKADSSSSNGHPNWPIYAKSCVRAVLKSSPLRMPPDKPYEAWATMTLVFNAREMLGL